jgi:hypothetical protein
MHHGLMKTLKLKIFLIIQVIIINNGRFSLAVWMKDLRKNVPWLSTGKKPTNQAEMLHRMASDYLDTSKVSLYILCCLYQI